MTAPVDILLVDDEPRNLDALESILSQAEYRLLRAQNADTALRLLLEHDVAVIVLDIQMPSVSGFELAQIIKTTKRFRETPIVFLTAFMLDDQHIAAGYGAGAVDYLTKPFNPQILQQKIAVFAELFRKTRALAELNATLEKRVKERTAELERSEALLRAASEQKDEFLAVLAHELRNPLAPLRTGLDLLLDQPRQLPVIDRTLSVMDRQLSHMVRLIDDLLDISRLSRGLLELKAERLDLQSVVLATAESFRAIVEQQHQVLEVACETDLMVNVDPIRVAQVVGNLLHNSTKFTPSGGTIRVELAREGESAVVRVTDSGIGIPMGQADKVFEMFARVERTGGFVQRGLGIGLSLGRRLAEMHGGTLEGASLGDDRGSTFTLVLPLSDAEDADDAEDRAPAEDASPPQLDTSVSQQVLIIEDNEDAAATLADLLRSRGHQVMVAATGADGVRQAQEMTPEIVLCDIGLPEMDGLEVCRRIRATTLSRQPLMVALTGWGRDVDRSRTQEAGFDIHLVKPVWWEDLERAMRRVRE